MSRWVMLSYSLGLVCAGFVLGKASCVEQPALPTPAPEIRQSDGSLVLERAPAIETPSWSPVVPPSHKAQRAVSVILKPKPVAAGCECEPVEAHIAVVKAPDGSSRVVVDSPNATVLTGRDVPLVADLRPPAARRLAVGVSGRLTGRDGQAAVGPFVEYDVGHLRLGASVLLDRSGRVELEARAGWTF